MRKAIVLQIRVLGGNTKAARLSMFTRDMPRTGLIRGGGEDEGENNQ